MFLKPIILFLFSQCVQLSYQQQCTAFEEIDPANYDRQYYTISQGDSGARPLGYVKATLLYQGDGPAPCYRVSGVPGQQVEIKFETVPSMRLCLKGKGTNFERCAEGRMSNCVTLTQSDLDLEFFCDVARGCAEGDVNFWLRLTKGPTPDQDTEGMWCHNLEEEYPESLRPLPPNFNPRTLAPTPSGSTVVTPSLCVTAILLMSRILI